MARTDPSGDEASFFSVPQARWVAGVLGMLVAVVGRESLRQARSEITSLVRDEGPAPADARAACYENN